MELLNIKETDPSEYSGKVVIIDDRKYQIGELIGQGGEKFVYQLINLCSGRCNYVIQIPIDQDLAAGNIDGEELLFDPWNGKSIYEYSRRLAKRTYNYDGYKERHLPIFADFLDFEEFSKVNNKYGGIFVIREYINGPGDKDIAGLHTSEKTEKLYEDFILNCLLEKYDVALKCGYNYLSENPYDDYVIERMIKLCIKLGREGNHQLVDETLPLTKRMLEIEPYLKAHLFLSAHIFEYFEEWSELVQAFEKVKDVIYEPYANEVFMYKVVKAYIMMNQYGKASDYSKYIRGLKERPRYYAVPKYVVLDTSFLIDQNDEKRVEKAFSVNPLLQEFEERYQNEKNKGGDS